MMNLSLEALKQQALACRECEAVLNPNPIIQISSQAKILIAGQAPGRKADKANKPFADASGDKLRQWMKISNDDFYNENKVAILPMGFCYPGSTKSGDIAPSKVCAPLWRKALLAHLKQVELTIVLGQYARQYHLPSSQLNLTETVKQWQKYAPEQFVLPHPSPRNQYWFKKNPWFEREVIPALQRRVKQVTSDN